MTSAPIPNSQTSSRCFSAALAAVTLIGIALRLAWLFQPMRYDESITFLDTALAGFWPAWTQYGPNNHVLHTLLVHLCTLWTSAEWAIRLPAFISGVCIVPVAGIIGRRWFGGGAGLIAAVLVACSAHLIEYSTNARGYSLVTLFALLQILLAERIAVDARHRDLILFALVTAAGLFTIPVMLYPTATTLAWAGVLIVARRDAPTHRRLVWRAPIYALACVMLTVLLYTPILLQKDGWHNLTANPWIAPITTFSGWRHLFGELIAGLWKEWSLGPAKPGLAILIAFAVIAILNAARQRDFRPAWLALGLVVCIALMAIQRVVPFVRVFSFALPVLLIVGAGGISMLMVRLWQKFETAFAIGLCVAMAIYVVAAKLPDRSSAFDKFPMARQMLVELAPHIDADKDTAVYGLLASAPMRYERFRTGKPPIVYQPFTKRLWLVTRDDESVDRVLIRNRLNAVLFNPPKLVFEKGHARMYELVPLAGLTPKQHRQPGTK